MFPIKLLQTTRMLITTLAFSVLAMSSSPLRSQEKPSDTGVVPAALSLANFEKFHKDLQPPKDELWRSVPWHVSIVEGQKLAAKEKKPIFVWVASGEPLGCG